MVTPSPTYGLLKNIEKATASAADLWDPRLGCLDVQMLVFLLAWCMPGARFGTNLSHILEASDPFGLCCKALVPFGLHCNSKGAQVSYLALLCRREHRFREICWILGQRVWQPVAACGGLWHPSRSPIEEDKMLRFQDSSCLGARTVRFQDSSCLGARRAGGFLDFSCLATWAGWADVLF